MSATGQNLNRAKAEDTVYAYAFPAKSRFCVYHQQPVRPVHCSLFLLLVFFPAFMRWLYPQRYSKPEPSFPPSPAPGSRRYPYRCDKAAPTAIDPPPATEMARG
jgi:hypothetical protein